MTAQPQENRYEVMLLVYEYWPETGDWDSRACAWHTFALLPEADVAAKTEYERCEDIAGTVILEDGVAIKCYGRNVGSLLPSGIVVGWMIWTGSDRPRHIHPGQWDPPEECFEELHALTPQEWERIERQTRRRNRRLYVKVKSFGEIELMGGVAGKRHKYTPDFFPLGRKMVKRFCSFCQEFFWFPHRERAGSQGYEACEKHCHLL